MKRLPLIGLCLMACNGDALSFEQDVAPIIETECVACHNPTLTEGELDLQTNPYSELLETDSTQSNYALITPGDSLNSYLWHKLNGSQALAGGSGTRMPLDGEMNVELAALVQAWVDQGALP